MQQPQIDESALVAMQQHMAQQAAFSSIPDPVKVVSWALTILVYDFELLPVYRSFPRSRPREQPRRNNGCV